MKVLLVTLGSRGDVHPLLGLGQALQARGHEATVLTNPAFAAEVAQAGLGFVPIGTTAQYEETLAHPKLWHAIDGLGVMWRYLLRPALQPTFDALKTLGVARGRGAAPLVLASPLAMGARVAQEALGLRLVTTYTAATMLRSVYDPLTIAHWQVPPLLPHWGRRALWRLLDRAKLDPLVKPALEALRGAQGLAPLAGRRSAVFDRWVHAPLGGLALFPDWFAAAQPDWPAQVHGGTFPLYDDPPPAPTTDTRAAAAGLQAFLDAGAAPLVFMPGSAQKGTTHFFRSAIAACSQLGLRGVLLGHAPALDAQTLPATVWAAPYVPFAGLLPRARAIVHHGGIGTCAQALRAGIPQLVWPQAYDQFDNALRLEQLGAGLRLRAQPVAVTELVARLGDLLGDAKVQQACRHWSTQLHVADLQPACAWLENLP